MGIAQASRIKAGKAKEIADLIPEERLMSVDGLELLMKEIRHEYQRSDLKVLFAKMLASHGLREIDN